jgi:hypothetical protein
MSDEGWRGWGFIAFVKVVGTFERDNGAAGTAEPPRVR